MESNSNESPQQLLERLHLKLVVADTDAQLQRFTTNHLVQVIKLAAENPGCVKQVTEILGYLNRRLRSNTAITLPIADLLDLHGGGAYQTNLSMVYLKIAVGRIPEKEAVELLPVLLQNISLRLNERSACDDMFLLTVPCFIAVSRLPKERWPKIECKEAVEECLARYFSIVLMCDFGMGELPMIVAHVADPQNPSKIPGMSADEVNFLAKKLLPVHSTLGELKLALVRLLDKDFLSEKVAFPVLQIGTSVAINDVADAASLALKKVDMQACVDDKAVVDQLMALYLGTAVSQTKYPANQQVPPASPIVQTKILPLLTRSSIAASTYMANIKVCLDVLKDPAVEYAKKTQLGFEFVTAVVNKMPKAALNAFGSTFFTKIVSIVEEGKAPNAICAAVAYRCLSALGKANPQLVLSKMVLLEQLFDAIPENAEEVSYAVMDCLSNWHDLFSDSTDETVLVKLKSIVKNNIGHENNRSRMTAIKYADALLRSGDMDVRWLLIKAAADKRDDVRKEAIRLLELSFKEATPPIVELVEYLWKELQNPPEKLSEQVFEMVTKFIWAACSVSTGDTHQLFHLDDDEQFFVTAPLVSTLLKGFPTESLEKIVRIAQQAATSTQDLYLLRIVACFATVYPITDTPTCPAACVQLTKGSTRFEMLETASFVSVITSSDVENSQKLEKYLSDLETNPMPGVCWLATSTAVYGHVTSKKAVIEKLISRLLKLLEDGYDRPSSTLESALGALCLLLKENHSKKEGGVLAEKETRISLIDVCLKIAASRKDVITLRSRIAAVTAIGLFDGFADAEILEKTLSALYSIGEGPPQSALQLTVGASLWTACLGPFAAQRRDVYSVSESSIKLTSLSEEERTWCEKNIDGVLEAIVEEKSLSRNHHLRRAAVVWLMVFVQKADFAQSMAIKPKIEKIQAAFAEGLTENDDFTQDIASKGMGMVYQLANEAEKKLLIADLMTSLTEGRVSTRKIQGDTVVFQDNLIGKAPDGSNLTTYKELCNLATDLNQPDLLYKFMQLAKHNATWNAKKGAAFGFGEILEQARDELQPYFGQLAPKLFRYRYDPDLKVQQSMRSIWNILTAGKRNVLEEYADSIAKELIYLLTDKEWRVRESACLAFADLLHSNDTPYMHSRIPELFETVMRVRDDIKESVRVAAERTAESLRKLIMRLATSQNKEKTEPFLNTLLPTIIEKGVNSTVKMTRSFSLVLLMDLAKTAGRHLQPFLHILIPCLLDAISENESAVLNYLAARSSQTQLEALDDARTHLASVSPMMTAVGDVMPHVNDSALQQMMPRVCEQLRTSVGVSTRAAAAQFITQLTLRAPQLLMDNKACCDKFFAALVPGVSDRNPSVRKNSANALSYLAKFSSAAPVDKLVKAMNKNLISDNDEMKRASLHVLKNFSAHCSDVIQGHGATLLPYIFLETCREVVKGDEASKRRHEEWNELWEEMVPSTNSALALYRKEVVSVAVDILQNNQVWVVKAQAGRMLARVAEALGTNLSSQDADSILTVVIPLLNGRTWDGKEKILLAVTSILKASGGQLLSVWSQEKQAEVADILRREAGRKKKDYVSFGLASCAAFAEHLKSEEMATWVQERTTAVVKKTLGGEGMISDSDDEGLSNIEKEAAACKFLSVNLIATVNSLPAYRNGTVALPAVEKLSEYLKNTNLFWKARQDALVELHAVANRWKLESPLPSDSLVQSLLTVAEEMCDQQRKSVAAQALQIVMRMAERRETFAMNWEQISTAIRNSRASTETGLADRLENAMEVD